MLNTRLQNEILKHAEESYPHESCGVIVKKGRVKSYIKCTNVSDENDLENEFTISADEYSSIEDEYEILAVVHSHPDATTQPSEKDKAVCSMMEIPWVICSWPDGDIRTITPEKAPLIDRPFVHGTDWDCYGLIRDYYDRVLDIKLNRYDHDSYWWHEGKDYYVENFSKEGFVVVTDGTIKEHDVILMKIRADKTNHGGIYMGGNIMLHHPFGKPSGRVVYGGYWSENTTHILRHNTLC